MGAGDFVVGDDLVVPIHDIQASIGSEVDGHRPEPFVGREQEILALGGQRNSRGILPAGDDLDFPGDRIGDVKDLLAGPFRGENAALVIGQGDPAQTGAAHRLAGRGGREDRGVGPEFFLRSGGVVGAGDEFGDRMAEVVRFLEVFGAVTRDGKAPDVVRSGGEGFEIRAVEFRPGEFALVEGFFRGAIGKRGGFRADDIRVVEESLRQIEPATWSAFELMGKQVGILHSEAC
jgi:hypothetical protein